MLKISPKAIGKQIMYYASIFSHDLQSSERINLHFEDKSMDALKKRVKAAFDALFIGYHKYKTVINIEDDEIGNKTMSYTATSAFTNNRMNVTVELIYPYFD